MFGIHLYGSFKSTPLILGDIVDIIYFIIVQHLMLKIWCIELSFLSFVAAYGYTATIIDGKSIAEDIRLNIAEEVRQMKSTVGHVPGLAVVLVGDRRDSESYVRYKTKGCEEVGIKSLLAKLPGNCTEDEVMDSVSRFNEDPSVHGILVQLPLPQVTCCSVAAFKRHDYWFSSYINIT